MTNRIPPAQSPFKQDIAEVLEKVMPPGVPPLMLFTTLARDSRLFSRFMAGGLLDKGNLSLRQREIIIDRTTALCGSEYEWGIHIALFAKSAGLKPEEIAATAKDADAYNGWDEAEQVLLDVCEELHANCDIGEKTWEKLRRHYSEEAILEVLMLAGYYRTVSYLTNALRLAPEPFAERFPID